MAAAVPFFDIAPESLGRALTCAAGRLAGPAPAWGRARGATARSAAGRRCAALSPLATSWDLLGALCLLTRTPTPWELPDAVDRALAAELGSVADRAVRLHVVTVHLDELDDVAFRAAVACAAPLVLDLQAVAA